MSATCGGCDATWTGLGAAHCAARGCHRTFTGVSAFDKHRSRKYREVDGRRVLVRDYGQCHDPGEDGMVLNDRGQWGMPDDGYWSTRRKDADSRTLHATESDEPARRRTRTRAGRK